MDPGFIALLIPLVALATGFVVVLKLPREMFRARPPATALPDSRLEALEEEVGRLRDELASTRERLDFTERLVAGRETSALGKGESPPAGLESRAG
jgi:hypothetical protein